MPFLLTNIARAGTIPNPLSYGTVPELIHAIVGAFQILAGGVATVMVLWGAFKILTAGGEPKKYDEGKKTIIYAAVGLAIIFLAGGVVSLVANILGKAGGETGVVQPLKSEKFGPIRGIDFPVSPPGPRPA